MSKTIKTYAGQDVGARQSIVTLEGFISDMDNAELADDSTVDVSDPVTAINGLICSLERRESDIERLRAALKECAATYIGSSNTVLATEFLRRMNIAAAALEQTKPDPESDQVAHAGWKFRGGQRLPALEQKADKS